MGSPLKTITVDGVTYNYDDYMKSLHTKNGKDVNANYISKDTFLQLMVKQMQYQDPLDPMDNSQYLSQLAQFSALEQMTNVADKMEDVYTLVENMDTSVLVGQLTTMIGKEVQWTDAEGETTYTGKATAVSISDGKPSLMVDVKDASGNVATTKVNINYLTRVGTSSV